MNNSWFITISINRVRQSAQPPGSMAPLPSINASEYPELDTGVRWSALAALAALLLGAMQGALGMESTSHCRLSYGKLRVFLFLQAVIVFAAISAQVHAHHQLGSILSTPNAPLRWLQWEPACVLGLGLAIICIDTYATIAACAGSRVLWHPLSCAYRLNGAVHDAIARGFEAASLSTTASLTMLLIGWRKNWWLEAAVVQSNTSAVREATLSGGAEGACIGVAVVVIAFVLLTIANFEATRLIGCGNSGDNRGIGNDIHMCTSTTPGPAVFQLMMYMARPNLWVTEKLGRTVMRRDVSAEHLRVYRLLHEIGHGADQGISFSRLSTIENLTRAPLHVGNAVINPDYVHVTDPQVGVLSENLKIAVLAAANLSTLPVLTCVVVAVLRLRHVLDRETLRALSALVDAVIVLALVTIAGGSKLAVWRAINLVDVHEFDIGPDDH